MACGDNRGNIRVYDLGEMKQTHSQVSHINPHDLTTCAPGQDNPHHLGNSMTMCDFHKFSDLLVQQTTRGPLESATPSEYTTYRNSRCFKGPRGKFVLFLATTQGGIAVIAGVYH